MKRKSGIHYAWVVLLACCAVQAGALGAISNCKGVFYDAICSELGMSLGAFTLQGVFAGIASAAITPFALHLLKKYRMHIVMLMACAVYSGTQFIMSYFDANLALWYGVAVIQALAGAFLLFLPVPIILNRWFVKKKGLAVAVATAFSGLSSMLLNPVYASITEQFGWRTGYRFVGVLSFVIMAPMLLFAMRASPEEKGLLPYGATQETVKANRTSVVKGKLERSDRTIMICLMMIAVCISCCSCFQSHLTKYGLTLGMTLEASAFLPSAAMLGGVMFKPLMGICSDRVGPNRTAFLFFLLNILGFVLLFLSGLSQLCLYAGALLCGVSMAANVVLFPLLLGNALIGYDFERYYTYLSMAISLTGVTSGAVFGYIFDMAGSYMPCYAILVAVAMICFVVLCAMRLLMSRKMAR